MITIKYVEPFLALSPNIAIVGSSGKLNNNEHGRIIDAHEDVVRFNRAPTKKYEHIVGSKTTLRVVNNHVFWNRSTKKSYTNQPKDFVKNLRNTRILCIAGKRSTLNVRDRYTHASNDVYVFAPQHVNKFRNIFNMKGVRTLSVGVAVICLCVVCGIKPDVFGFDVDLEDKSRTHYWEGRPGPGPCHKINIEKKILIQLAEDEKINLI